MRGAAGSVGILPKVPRCCAPWSYPAMQTIQHASPHLKLLTPRPFCEVCTTRYLASSKKWPIFTSLYDVGCGRSTVQGKRLLTSHTLGYVSSMRSPMRQTEEASSGPMSRARRTLAASNTAWSDLALPTAKPEHPHPLQVFSFMIGNIQSPRHYSRRCTF